MELNEIKPITLPETFQAMVARLFKRMDNDTEFLLHAAVGMAGESAEVMLAVCNCDSTNIREELGDARFYMQAVFNLFGWEMTGGAVRPVSLNNNEWFVVACSDVLDLAKKSWVYGKPLELEPLYQAMRQASSAYLSIVASHGYIDEDIRATNMYKLSTGPNARYPLGYTDAAAIARADKVAEEAAYGGVKAGAEAYDPEQEEAAAPAAAEASPFKELLTK